jgi:translation initiation factor IF-3
MKGGRARPKIERPNKINEEIEAREVRLIDQEGEQLGVVKISDAIDIAAKAEMDLVEMAATASPPVCKIMDYGKYLFELKKSKAEAKKKQKQIQVKEIKFRPGTDIGDYNVKLKKLTQFLEDGDKAKVTMRFRGREMAHQEIGLELLRKVEKDLEELAICESRPRLEGRQMVMVLGPKKRK